MKKCIATWVILFLMASAVEAGGPGTTNANFLKAGQGVRPVAMGETYIALGDGLDTLHWNPAGLIQLTTPTAGFNHTFWVQDIGTEYLAFGMPLGALGAVGGGVTIVRAGTIEKTLEDASGNYAGTDGLASAWQIALVGVFSQKLSHIIPTGNPFLKNVLVGAGIRLVSETIDEVNIFGGGIDIGAIWRQTEQVSVLDLIRTGNRQGAHKSGVRDRGWRVGFVAQNLGLTSDKLMPINFRVGAGYLAREVFSPCGRGTLGLDVLIPIDNEVKISLGGEYAHITPHTEFAVRAGYKIGHEIKDMDSLAGLTTGAGFAVSTERLKYQLDYAFVPYGELGSAHRISLTVAFLPGRGAVLSREVKPALLPPTQIETGFSPGIKAKPEKEQDKGSAAAPSIPKVTSGAEAETESAAQADAVKVRQQQLRKSLQRILTRIKSGMLPPITFNRDKTAFVSEAKRTLDQVGSLLERYPDDRIIIIGYAGKNTELAGARAKFTSRFLTMRYRINRTHIITKSGEPEKQPGKSSVSFEVATQ